MDSYNPDSDLYELLGVKADATASQIKRAHRDRIKAVHPDRENGDHDQAVALNHARDVLLDPAQRSAYDAARAAWAKGSWEDFASKLSRAARSGARAKTRTPKARASKPRTRKPRAAAGGSAPTPPTYTVVPQQPQPERGLFATLFQPAIKEQLRENTFGSWLGAIGLSVLADMADAGLKDAFRTRRR